MTYKETLEWLYNQLPMFQKVGGAAYKKDLTNTLALTNHLGNPHTKFKTIHVGGTNGKGSTSSMLAAILMEAGYKVGLYTSPHLKDFRERITLNGKPISQKYVVNFVANNKDFFAENNLSFFEMTVGLAFQYFADQKVDVAIIEVGMGGRLDSTNIITPLVSVITTIGFDHMQFLGSTLEAIAGEKAGIIKPNVPVIIGEYTKETKAVFEAIAMQENATLIFAQDNEHVDYPSELKGNYQNQNKQTVVATCRVLEKHFNLTETHIKKGIANVVSLTGLKGRWQIIQEKPKVVCDTAHNSQGLALVIQQIKQEQFDNLHIVLGVVNDKDLGSILPLFPTDATYYFCKPAIERGLDASLLQSTAATYGLKGKTYTSVKLAKKAAISHSTANDFIYIGGSTFVVAEVI
jgi:dihydrofolate synthase/folylpolyglutamate synthase|nr:folylpolyglutamate synthase/dihydrofolate synthase family protein [uncultured Flavobacterium sp.]